MNRVSRKELEQTVRRLVTLTGQPFELDYLQEGVRLGVRGRYLSPRMKKKDMALWLSAFEEGLGQSGVERMREALGSAPILPEDHLAAATPRTAADLQQWGATYNEWYNKDRANAVVVKS